MIRVQSEMADTASTLPRITLAEARPNWSVRARFIWGAGTGLG
jgi:hypothetical protein